MTITEKIILDCLNTKSVSILRQTFSIDENGIESQIGENIRVAYMNNEICRNELQQKLPEDKWNELIAVWGDTPTVETIKPAEPSLEEIKNSILNSMSNICNKTIENGFNIILSDREISHFSLTTQDQLNLITLSAMLQSGQTVIPYHADGKECRYYSVEDMNTIITYATTFKTYHTTYFNNLRNYIEGIEDINVLKEVTYGMDIPEEYQSDVLKHLIQEMNISQGSDVKNE